MVLPDSEESVPKNVYFANLTGPALGAALMEKVEDHFKFYDDNGRFKKMDASFRCYHGEAFNSVVGDASEITKDGPAKEIARMRVNHYRNIILHQLSAATNELPVGKAICTNTDHKTIGQASLGDGVLDHYRRKLDLAGLYREAARYGLKFACGYVVRSWDPYIGEPTGAIDPATNWPVRTGDFVSRTYTPIDMIVDPYLDSARDCKWWIHRDWVNKYDLAAQYPHLAEKILGLDSKDSSFKKFRFHMTQQESDLVALYTFLHDKTPAVPDGKQIQFCDKDVVLTPQEPQIDPATGETVDPTALPYRRPRVYRLAPDETTGSPHGDSINFDLLSIQEALDHLYTVVLTNQKSFGIQNILVPEGANLSRKQLMGALNIIKYNPINNFKPEALNLTSTPREIFEFIKQLEVVMETLSAVNAVARGNAPTNFETGAPLALLEGRMHAFLAGLMKGLVKLVQEYEQGLIEDFQDFAKAEQKIVVAGKAKEYTVKALTGDSVGAVDMVHVEAVNPASNSFAAKLDAADKLLMAGLIDAHQYLEIRRTGNADIGSEKKLKEAQLIRKENELLEQGQPAPMPALTDNHLQHINEHACVLADPIIRMSRPDVVQMTLEHITQHQMLLATPDPIQQNLLLATGQQPLMLPPAPPETAAGGTPEKGTPPKPKGQEPRAGEAQPAKKPDMPINPSTGQRWDPATGGGVTTPGGVQ